MKYYSTNSPSQYVDFRTAVLQSLPSDNGLYMPHSINKLDPRIIETLDERSFAENSYLVAKNLIGDALPETILETIVHNAINFAAPLHTLNDRLHVLELWHGPSLAFKDFGARFMAETMSYLVKDETDKLTILVATSGDTGGAVAAGFHNIPNIDVVILFPKGRVSELQQLQLTTWGDNIRAIEVEGSFDDCQALVKQAFLDPELNKRLKLSSANSINITRLIPQSFYYFEAYRQLDDRQMPVVFSIPSGNFGNLTAGLLAKRMGLPVHKFLAATNANDIVPQYLASGEYHPKPSIATLSNAMDVGNPSNFRRMEHLYGSLWQDMKKDIVGYSFSDTEVLKEIRDCYNRSAYTLDPHGAVGKLAIDEWQKEHPLTQSILLETAHPAKFLPTVVSQLGYVDVPKALSDLRSKTEKYQSINAEYMDFVDCL